MQHTGNLIRHRRPLFLCYFVTCQLSTTVLWSAALLMYCGDREVGFLTSPTFVTSHLLNLSGFLYLCSIHSLNEFILRSSVETLDIACHWKGVNHSFRLPCVTVVHACFAANVCTNGAIYLCLFGKANIAGNNVP